MSMSPPIARTFAAPQDPVPTAMITPATQYMSHGIISGVQMVPAGTAYVPAPPTYEVIPNRIFVGGFPSSTTESELREHFEQFHPVKDVKMVKSLDGASKGYGFVTFEIEDHAEEVRQLNPKQLEFRGRKLNLGPAIRKMSSGPYTQGFAITTPAQLVPASPSPFGFSISPTAPMVFFPHTQQTDQSPLSPLSTPTTQTQFFFANDTTPARSYANAVAGPETVVSSPTTEIPKNPTTEVTQNAVVPQYVQQPPQQYTAVPQNQYNQPTVQQGSFDQQQQQDPSNVQNPQYYNYGYQYSPSNAVHNGDGDKNGTPANGYMPTMHYYQNGANYQNVSYPYMPYQYSSYSYHHQNPYNYGYPRYAYPTNQVQNNGYHQNPQYPDNGTQNQIHNQNGQPYHQQQYSGSGNGYQYPPLATYTGSDVSTDYGNSRNSPTQPRGTSNGNKKNRYSESRDENMKGNKASPNKGTRGDKRTWSGGNSSNDVSQKGKNLKSRGQLTPLTNKMRSLSISSNGNNFKN